MSEHPQQTDRVLRDTRILTLRIWTVVGCIVIAAVIFNLMGILAPVIEFLAVGSIIAFVMSPITNWLEHGNKIILWKHYLVYLSKIIRFILLHPQYLRCCETCKCNICCIF